MDDVDNLIVMFRFIELVDLIEYISNGGSCWIYVNYDSG